MQDPATVLVRSLLFVCSIAVAGNAAVSGCGNAGSGVADSGSVQDGALDGAVGVDSAIPRDSAAAPDRLVTPPTDGNLGTGPFAGMFGCNLSYTANVTSPVVITLMRTAAVQTWVTENGTGVTAFIMGDGGLSCALTLTDNGNGTASLAPADTQACYVTDNSPIGLVPVTITFSMGGTAELMLPSLRADSVPITVTDGPRGTIGLMGTGTFNVDCMR